MIDNSPKLVFEPITKKDLPICEFSREEDIIYINTGPCCENCTTKCYRSKKKCCKDCLAGISGSGCQNCEQDQCFCEFDISDQIGHISDKLLPVPNINSPEHGFIFGPTKSGKSVFCTNYAQQYQKYFNNNPVYLISDTTEDKEIEKINDLIKISMEDIMDDLITPESIHDSLVIFDDTDSIIDKDVFKKVERVRDRILTKGRHNNVYCLVTLHIGANHNHSRVPINESGFVVVFPKGGNWHQIDTILHKYGGLTKKQEDVIQNLPSRWVMFHKHYPPYILHEKGCYLI